MYHALDVYEYLLPDVLMIRQEPEAVFTYKSTSNRKISRIGIRAMQMPSNAPGMLRWATHMIAPTDNALASLQCRL